MGSDEKKNYYNKLKDEKLQGEILKWWKDLLENSGSKAQLKRCATPADAALHPETHRAINIFPRWVSVEASACAAGILAHIKADGNGMFGKKLGMEDHGRIPFSEMRFRQLLSCKEWNEFYTAMRRAVTMLDGKVNPLSVVDVILHWDEEHRGAKYSEPSKSLKFLLSKDYYSQILK